MAIGDVALNIKNKSQEVINKAVEIQDLADFVISGVLDGRGYFENVPFTQQQITELTAEYAALLAELESLVLALPGGN